MNDYQIVGPVDDHTCPTCQDLIGRKADDAGVLRVALNVARRRHAETRPNGYSEIGHGCRCAIVPGDDAERGGPVAEDVYVPRKVYLITAGEYSDYHVEAAFSSRDGAVLWLEEAYPSHAGYDDPRIEEIFLDPRPRPGETPPPGMTVFRVSMFRDGDVASERWLCDAFIRRSTGVDAVPSPSWGESYLGDDDHIERTESRQFLSLLDGDPVPEGKDLLLVAYVAARDKDHAIKIANERRTYRIALGEFLQEDLYAGAPDL
uniref:Uncharacterized protein n=1 Tax=viral metagenome TaxID=1070528 RepID=A0A6M3J911_9ZZZZ